MSREDTLRVIENLVSRFFTAKEELSLELSPEKSGYFVATLTNYWNETGDLPSKDAIKIMLQLEHGMESIDA